MLDPVHVAPTPGPNGKRPSILTAATGISHCIGLLFYSATRAPVPLLSPGCLAALPVEDTAKPCGGSQAPGKSYITGTSSTRVSTHSGKHVPGWELALEPQQHPRKKPDTAATWLPLAAAVTVPDFILQGWCGSSTMTLNQQLGYSCRNKPWCCWGSSTGSCSGLPLQESPPLQPELRKKSVGWMTRLQGPDLARRLYMFNAPAVEEKHRNILTPSVYLGENGDYYRGSW